MSPRPAIKQHHRWKYAEEDAKCLIDSGRIVAITMVTDVPDEEQDDPEHPNLFHDEFVVTDCGPRRMGRPEDD